MIECRRSDDVGRVRFSRVTAGEFRQPGSGGDLVCFTRAATWQRFAFVDLTELQASLRMFLEDRLRGTTRHHKDTQG